MAAASRVLTIRDVRNILSVSLPAVTDDGERRLPGIRARVDAFNTVVTAQIGDWINGTIEPDEAIQAIKLSLLNQFRENIVQAADVPEHIEALDTALAQLEEPAQVLFLVGGVIASLDRAGISYTQTINHSILRSFVTQATRVVVGLLRVFSGLISRMGDAARAVVSTAASLASAVFTYLITPRVPARDPTLKEYVKTWIEEKSFEELDFNDIRIALLPLFQYRPSSFPGIDAALIRKYEATGMAEVSARVMLAIASAIFEKEFGTDFNDSSLLWIGGDTNTNLINKKIKISLICSNLIEQFIASNIAAADHIKAKDAAGITYARRTGTSAVAREGSGVTAGGRVLSGFQNRSDIREELTNVQRCVGFLRAPESGTGFYGTRELHNDILTLLNDLPPGPAVAAAATEDDRRLNNLLRVLNSQDPERDTILEEAKTAYLSYLIPPPAPADAAAPVAAPTMEEMIQQQRRAHRAAAVVALLPDALAAAAVGGAPVAASAAAAAGAIMNAPVASSAAASGGAATGGASAAQPLPSLEDMLGRLEPSSAVAVSSNLTAPPPVRLNTNAAARAILGTLQQRAISAASRGAPSSGGGGGRIPVPAGFTRGATAAPVRTTSSVQPAAAAGGNTTRGITVDKRPTTTRPKSTKGMKAKRIAISSNDAESNSGSNDDESKSESNAGGSNDDESNSESPQFNASAGGGPSTGGASSRGGARRTRRRRHRTTHRRRPQQRRRQRMSRRHRVSRRQRRS